MVFKYLKVKRTKEKRHLLSLSKYLCRLVQIQLFSESIIAAHVLCLKNFI